MDISKSDVFFKLQDVCRSDEEELEFIDNAILCLKEALRLNGFNKRNIDKLESLS